MRLSPYRLALILSLLLPGISLTGVDEVLGPDPEFVGFNSPESWGMKYFSSVLLPGGVGVPRAMEPGAWAVELEVAPIPSLSVEERRVGFSGTKVDDLNQVDVLLRPQVEVGLPFRFSASFSIIPPISFQGLESTLASLSLNRPLLEYGGWRTGIRLFAAFSKSKGAFTCTEHQIEAGHDLFDCRPPSHDISYLRTQGVELSLSYTFSRMNGLTPFVKASRQHMDNHFQTDAVIFNGNARDRRTLKTEGYTNAFTAGFELPLKERWNWSLSFFYAPLDVIRSGVPGDPAEEDSLVTLRSRVRFQF